MRLARVVAVLAVLSVVTLVCGVATAIAADTLPAGVPVFLGPVILGVLQWLAGAWLKKQPGTVNNVIGWVTLLLSALGFMVMPKDANAAVSLGAIFGPVAGLAWPVVVGLQTVVVTGIHEWVRHSILAPILGRTGKGTEYFPAKA